MTVTQPTANDSTEQLLKGLRLTYSLVQELSERVNRLESASRLGFGEAPYTRTINCKRRDDCPSWYFWNGPERGAEAIEHGAITGYATDLAIREGDYKGKTTYYLQLLLSCGDRSLILESGFRPGEESAFSKCLLSGLVALTSEQLKRPITVSASPGTDEDTVLLCSVYQDGQKVGTYDKNANWQELFHQVSASIKRANS